MNEKDRTHMVERLRRLANALAEERIDIVEVTFCDHYEPCLIADGVSAGLCLHKETGDYAVTLRIKKFGAAGPVLINEICL
ncbi:hypothetical protein KP003_16725 [Geomonas nitrogeniifigens]|uniref:hypothetical protein n=1 Tax=Geomonas diazotrophica TaxID=2843197 RepID=UPI001C2C0096|nr:hypothetical protein [Geomonas nitrogeniifigens]QXE85986.1 hypothetical protein KP003_16725 [Geomonas nitrogeniifigens]